MLKKSVFFDFLHRNANIDYASFLSRSKEDVDYINWHDFCLPMAYGDEKSEYMAVRNTCALFDASPIKKYHISGADAGCFLDAVLTRQVSTQKSMRVSYAVLCNEDGMLLDDGLLYKFGEDNYLLMVSEIDHDEHFARVSHGFGDLKIDDISPALSGLAFQGPSACRILNRIGFTSIQELKPFEIKHFPFGDEKVTIARVGFTADLGYEMWFEPQLNKVVEQSIRDAEIKLGIKIDGYGLKALNALRIEGGFIVPGWDTAQTFEDNADERTPTELGISWTVDLDRRDDFIGKTALLQERKKGPRFKTMGIAIDHKRHLEEGIKVYTHIDGMVYQVGTLPSVAWSYGFNRWIGIASIQTDFVKNDLEYHVKVAGEPIACGSMKLPFVKFDRHHRVPAPI